VCGRTRVGEVVSKGAQAEGALAREEASEGITVRRCELLRGMPGV
jgi:hypothetical protein